MILGAFSPNNATIEVGATYTRKSKGAFVEKAYVLELAPDKMGIPHVRYKASVQRGSSKPIIETRTLSLEAFLSRFH